MRDDNREMIEKCPYKLYNGDIFASFEALLSNHYKKHSEMVLIQLSYPNFSNNNNTIQKLEVNRIKFIL